jgi:hypothetical protein
MTLLVDTSVWSLAFRRDRPSTAPEVQALRRARNNRSNLNTARRRFRVGPPKQIWPDSHTIDGGGVACGVANARAMCQREFEAKGKT